MRPRIFISIRAPLTRRHAPVIEYKNFAYLLARRGVAKHFPFSEIIGFTSQETALVLKNSLPFGRKLAHHARIATIFARNNFPIRGNVTSVSRSRLSYLEREREYKKSYWELSFERREETRSSGFAGIRLARLSPTS